MYKLIAAILLSVSGIAVAAAGSSWGDWWQDHKEIDRHFNAPEIDPSSAITALTLLVGGITILRGRISKK